MVKFAFNYDKIHFHFNNNNNKHVPYMCMWKQKKKNIITTHNGRRRQA